MFARVRTSRSKRVKKERQTYKVSQRGGDFAVIGVAGHGMPGPAPTDPSDNEIWHKGLDAAGLADLKILFTGVPVLTTDTTDALKATRINTWFKLIGEQNKVARIPITYVQREFLKRVLSGFTVGGVAVPPVTPLRGAGSKEYTTVASIDAIADVEELTEVVLKYVDKLKVDYVFLRGILKRLVAQFEAVMNMGDGTNLDEIIPTNKFEEMFSDKQKSKNIRGGGPNVLYNKIVQEFEGVLINPQRMENVLMEEVVEMLKVYKDQDKLKADILLLHPLPDDRVAPTSIATVNEKITNLRLLVTRVTVDTHSNTVKRTGKELVDGWTPGGRPAFMSKPRPAPAGIPNYYNEYTITEFWDDFYETMSGNFNRDTQTFTLSRLVEEDVNEFGILAAKILIAKLNGNTVEDLYPNPAPGDPYNEPIADFEGIPNREYYSVAYKPGKTLQEMHKWIQPTIDVYFLKYLEYQLQ